MSNESPYLVSVSRVIDATPQRLFDLVATPAMHPVLDGGGTVKAVRDGGPQRLSLGSTFAMDMHLAADYKILNRVVEFEEGRRIGWRHFNGHIWRYLFEPTATGTTVTEQWDAREAKNRLALRLLRFPARNRAAIEGTLRRLDEVANDPRY